MKLKTIPLELLKISKLNMRAKASKPDISDILPNIRAHGIHQTLLVRPEGDMFGIVAGRRRYHALLQVAEETGEGIEVPCGILDSEDDAVAIEASIIENMARLPATELEQFAAFKKLKSAGRSVSDIAVHFGVTDLKVKRILALANLKPAILKFYEQGEIDVKTIRLLTMASKSKQAEWMKLAKHEEQEAPTGHWLKTWLTGEEQITADAALFDMKDYKGAVLTDLFGETEYFSDPDMFWELQNPKIAEMVSEYEAQGWPVDLLERGQRFQNWNYVKRSKESGGRVFISVAMDGIVTAHEGYLSAETAQKIQAILTNNDGKSEKRKTTKPEMSAPLADYVALHRHGAVRATLLSHTGIALRLCVAHMLVGSELWTVEAQKTTTRKEATTESVAGSQGAQTFETEREAIYEILGVEQAQGSYFTPKCLTTGDIVELFAKLLELDDKTVLRVLTFAMAESLEAGTRIIEALTYVVPVDMTTLWQPDDAFFDILRDKKVINAMVKEIAGKRTADAAFTDTGKAQKQIIRNRMAGHGAEANPDWRPRWMRSDVTHYLDRVTCPPAQANAAIAKIMGGKNKAKDAA